MTPNEIAKRCAALMGQNDRSAKLFGIALDAVSSGKAVVSLVVKKEHLNGHDICHGGVIYTLADTAFAYACNSYNQNALAQHNSITYISPARCGERLVASAREVSKSGRSGIYDVIVTGENERHLAEFRGHSRLIGGKHFEENEENHD